MNNEHFSVEVHKGREVVYAVISRIFLEVPSAELYKMLGDILPLISCMVDESADDLTVDGLATLDAFLKKRASLDDEARVAEDDENLRRFTRLFCLTDSVAVSESVYLSPEHLTMQEQTGEVNALYKSANFSMDIDSNEPSDHIACEAMFMAYLAKGTAASINKDNFDNAHNLIKFQKSFIDTHLLSWLPEFVKTLLKFPESVPFYLPAAYFMLGYVKADAAFLSE